MVQIFTKKFHSPCFEKPNIFRFIRRAIGLTNFQASEEGWGQQVVTKCVDHI